MKRQRQLSLKSFTGEKKTKIFQRGDVKCCGLKYSTNEPTVSEQGYLSVNVSKYSHNYSVLSPMILGGIEYRLEEDGRGDTRVVKIKNLENCWQYSKVWNGEVDSDNNPTEVFWKRRKRGWDTPEGHRRVKNTDEYNYTLYTWWKGEKLDYMQARKKVYCPLYVELVTKTKEYKELKEKADRGQNVMISGFDGYDYSKKGLKACFNDVSKPFGHELVLCGLLTDNRVWE